LDHANAWNAVVAVLAIPAWRTSRVTGVVSRLIEASQPETVPNGDYFG